MAGKSMLESSLVDDAPDEEVTAEESPFAATPEETAADTLPEAVPGAELPRTPITRRTKAKERDESILKELRDTRDEIKKQGETYGEQLRRMERENAELRGHVQGLASRPVETRREEPQADPDKLLEEANRLLDAKDFNGYQRKFAEYNREIVARDPRFRPQATPAAQPQVSPMLQMVASQYIDVMSDRAALEIAQAHDRILQAQGVPESPERWKKAFDEGRRYAARGKDKAPTFSTKNREVLSGVPTSRNGAAASGGGGEPGIVLSEYEKSTAKRFKMSEREYARELAAMHPERVDRD